MSALLSVQGVHTFYGSIEALKGVDVTINEGEIVTLIGANGAGKSTLLMTICGKPQAREGRIVFAGEDITRLATHDLVRRGIAQSPEGRRIFPRMTVMENLQMGAIAVDDSHFDQDLEEVFTLFPRLKERITQRAGTMSGGEQQMLAIGRGLMVDPEMLLFDEPSLGLAPIIVETIFALIQKIRDFGKTILLIEQNANMALAIADRGYVMETGNIILSGSAKELANNPGVASAYLGI